MPNVFAQAQTYVGHFQFGQAQAKIKTTRVYAQAQGVLNQSRYVGQANADILVTSQKYAQARATILGHIRVTQISIEVLNRSTVLKARVTQIAVEVLHATYNRLTVSGQAAAFIGVPTAFGQAQALVKNSIAYGQAQALISGQTSGQAAAQITNQVAGMVQGYAQAQISSIVRNKNSSGQALALIAGQNFIFVDTYNRSNRPQWGGPVDVGPSWETARLPTGGDSIKGNQGIKGSSTSFEGVPIVNTSLDIKFKRYFAGVEGSYTQLNLGGDINGGYAYSVYLSSTITQIFRDSGTLIYTGPAIAPNPGNLGSNHNNAVYSYRIQYSRSDASVLIRIKGWQTNQPEPSFQVNWTDFGIPAVHTGPYMVVASDGTSGTVYDDWNVSSINNGFQVARGQAAADILAISTNYSTPYAQAQAKINSFGVKQFGQAQTYVGHFKFAQAQAKIKTTRVYGQAQSDIKATSNKFAQANTDILVLGKNVFAQSNAQIILIQYSFSQAQVDIEVTTNQFGQSQSDILVTTAGFAQAQAGILETYYGFAQSQADIVTTYQGFSQSQADIQVTSYGFAETQASILAEYQSIGQAQGEILQVYNVAAQAQSLIKQEYISVGQAEGLIKTTYKGFAQGNSYIKITLNAYGQAEAFIQTFHLVQSYGQAQATVTSHYYGLGQAQGLILRTSIVVGNAQAKIVTTIINIGQAQALIILIRIGQAQAYIKVLHTLKKIKITDRNISIFLEDREFKQIRR